MVPSGCAWRCEHLCCAGVLDDTSLHSFGAPPLVTREWLPVSFEWSNYLRLFDLLPLEHYPLNSRS
ncbi:hypothetical protein [Roseiflexus castenholzii]|jgi:hypothetical protein|uniref:hypothetical protein n=1 Tax=Roseiflexus castenholzii TaxID=120962 RepID=UPI0002F98131|nr:hypothetical protein [Roseiflexus castenholzii]